MKSRGIQTIPERAYILLLLFLMASCFQLDPIDTVTPMVDAPPVIDYRKLKPPPDRIVIYHLDSDEKTVTFNLNRIFDANGYEHEELYGRWFVDYELETRRVGWFSPERQDPTIIPAPDADAGSDGEEDGLDCPGCCWEGSFSVSDTDFIRGEGCYQILAVVSDSEWEDCRGWLCTETPTILARVIWWVWVTSESSPEPPDVEQCHGIPFEINEGP